MAMPFGLSHARRVTAMCESCVSKSQGSLYVHPKSRKTATHRLISMVRSAMEGLHALNHLAKSNFVNKTTRRSQSMPLCIASHTIVYKRSVSLMLADGRKRGPSNATFPSS